MEVVHQAEKLVFLCPTCQGSGKVRPSQGFFTIERTCQDCAGTGRTISNPCKNALDQELLIKKNLFQ